MAYKLKAKLSQFDATHLSNLETVGFDSNRSRKQLPPLQTLIAFEAAARLRSFTLAAHELNLTQPAVSQQVRLLEDRLGTSLFARSNSRITLTESGEAFAATVADALNRLAASADEVRSDSDRHVLSLSLLPSFASTWFAHRVGRFEQLNPDIDLVILYTVALTQFGQEHADAAIRWGRGGWSGDGLFEEKLLSENYIFAASPTLLKHCGPIANIEDIAGLPFVHDTDHTEWEHAVAANGGDPDQFRKGLYFGDASGTVETIVSGHGVGVVRDVLVEHLLEDGRLVQLPLQPVPGPYSYYFVCPEDRADRPQLTILLQWLQNETDRSMKKFGA